ncbi:MAG: rhomboid family intramembrane serine protease [Flavobacteriales bacterium]|nr:rhomboid family intramembrane serine protease [Flavobacteriales bacterium]
MESIFNKFKREFKQGTILNKLIYINVGVFLFFSILGVLSFMFQFDITLLLEKLYLPANHSRLLSQPWTFITYMFLHNGFLHLLFNMVWLHFGGKIFLQYLKPKQLLSTYILGGVSGGLLFVIAYNYIPALQAYSFGALAMGASASVLAIIVAIATYTPNYSVQFPFIGFVKLKHIAIFSVALDIISIPKGNTGGHIAHIGGALFGYIYIKQMRKGNDFSKGFSSFLERLINTFKPKSKLKTVHKRAKSDYDFNKEKSAKQKEIDIILEKIANSGYESLSKEEKATLFSASKK